MDAAGNKVSALAASLAVSYLAGLLIRNPRRSLMTPSIAPGVNKVNKHRLALLFRKCAV